MLKLQANIDAQHRDRIAFVRIASGRFKRNNLGRKRAISPV
jgi:peptide subunit release factor RF-3